MPKDDGAAPTLVEELEVPDKVREELLGQGITELYPPQADALQHALAGKNLVLAIPTASGKTLVALLGVLKKVLAKGKGLYIVPLKALAEEKYHDFKAFEHLGFRVGMSVGDYDDLGRELEKCDIVVATSEKADSLSRHDLGWIERLSVVVADEVHLMHDPSRGPTLEVLLARIRTINPRCQIIALSATIQNSMEIAEWLDAAHVTSDFRPVVLKEGVFLDGEITYTDNSREEFPFIDDGVVSVVSATASNGEQSLVFVNTRKSTEAMAERLAKYVREGLPTEELANLKDVAGRLRRADAETTSVADRLAGCLSFGVAFHHAGLSPGQRRVVETAFKDRLIRCIVATPTLAAGINLPAKRVIVRDVRRYDSMYGNLPIPVLEIKQMLGRAGRPRYDTEGQAILVAKTDGQRSELLERYLLGEPERIYSKLGTEAALRSHVLASIATGIVADEGDLERFIDSTFYAYQAESWTLEERVERALEFLEEEELVSRDGKRLWPTKFGRRVSDLYIDPLSAVLLRQAIERAGHRDEVPDLAWLQALCTTPDLPTFFLRRSDYRNIAELAERHRDDFLVEDVDDELEREDFLGEVKTASMFVDWIGEQTEDFISTKYNIGPGDIRAKVDTGRWLIYAASEIARLFSYPDLRGRLRDLERRVSYGVREELLPLVALRGVGRKRGRALHAKGYRKPSDIKSASVAELAAVPGIGTTLATNIVEQLGGDRRPPRAKGTTFEEENGQTELEPDPAPEETPSKVKPSKGKDEDAAQLSLQSFGSEGDDADG
jgi:helicase